VRSAGKTRSDPKPTFTNEGAHSCFCASCPFSRRLEHPPIAC
jgi:hypothetical protein